MTAGNVGKVGLVCGAASTLGQAVALEFSRHGLQVALHDDTPGGATGRLEKVRDAVQDAGGEALVVSDGATSRSMVDEVIDGFGRLDFLINLYTPDPETEDTARVTSYPGTLLERCQTVGSAIADAAEGGAIINQSCLPSLYAGTSLEGGMPLLRNGVTGVTRSACLRFAGAGVRVNSIHTGFLEMPETRSFAGTRVCETPVPIGRWSTPEEFAKLAAFLALRATYMTGQGVVLDGGLTAGNTGT
jgi:NAD(P)-dependent dehydrogenase (short-subunit alcohol dehydrogenase family)